MPLAGQPNVLVVAPSAGVKTVAELIALAKQKPGQLNFGSAGTGSGTHINAEKFKLAAGIDVLHIPYKGTPEALTDTMAGRVTYFFSPISAALPNVREGRLLALGVSTAKRSAALPNVPTIAESGLPGFDYNLWVGMERHPALKSAFEFQVMSLMSEVMAHTITLHLLDAPGRVHRFMRKHAELAERLPKKELAAYLNISPETLSRLKQRGKI